MKTATHTPGPWNSIDGQVLKVHDNTKHIATCWKDHGISSKENEANARLIAAAPQLVEALKAIKIRLHFVGHPSEPIADDGRPDWSHEANLIESVMLYAILHGDPETIVPRPDMNSRPTADDVCEVLEKLQKKLTEALDDFDQMNCSGNRTAQLYAFSYCERLESMQALLATLGRGAWMSLPPTQSTFDIPAIVEEVVGLAEGMGRDTYRNEITRILTSRLGDGS